MPARVVTPSLLALVVLAVLAAPAAADPAGRLRTEMVWVDPIADLAPDVAARSLWDSHVSKIIFVNRCAGGCQLTPGVNDSRANTSSLVPSPSTVEEFSGTDEV